MAATGTILAVAGQIGWDSQQRLVSDQFANQFDQALRNVITVVESAGGHPEDIISLTIYVTDKQTYANERSAVGRAYRDVMGKHFPAMALLEVAGLLEPGAQVEIQALAVISREHHG